MDAEFPAIANASDWDATIPIPYHCIVRMVNIIQYNGGVTNGSALHRDIVQVINETNAELKRTNNIQGKA